MEDNKTWRWCTTAQVISKAPVRLYGIIMTPSATNAECKIYDGESTADPLMGEVFTATKVTREFYVNGGVKTHRGLYIGAFTSITGVFVIWEPLEP